MNENTIEKLQVKKTLLEDMLGTIKTAVSLLKEDKIEEFDRELQNCEQIMHKVDELGRDFAGEKSPEAMKIEKDIERILSEIVEANKECKEISEEKKKGFGNQIKALREKRQGLDAYNQTVRNAVFIDEKK